MSIEHHRRTVMDEARAGRAEREAAPPAPPARRRQDIPIPQRAGVRTSSSDGPGSLVALVIGGAFAVALLASIIGQPAPPLSGVIWPTVQATSPARPTVAPLPTEPPPAPTAEQAPAELVPITGGQAAPAPPQAAPAAPQAPPVPAVVYSPPEPTPAELVPIADLVPIPTMSNIDALGCRMTPQGAHCGGQP